MDDLLHLLDGLVRSIAPGFAGLAAASAIPIKFLVDLVKRYRPDLRGNAARVVALVVSAAVVIAEALAIPAPNAFSDGVDVKEVAGLLLSIAIAFFVAVGFNEMTEDRGKGRRSADR
jgi:hypothetical protein